MASPQKENGYTAIANELLWEIGKFGFSPTEYSILFYVMRYTYGYNRKTALIIKSNISKEFNIDKSLISRYFNNLIKNNILIFSENGEIGINKNYETWKSGKFRNKPKLQKVQQVAKQTTIESCKIDNSELQNRQLKVAKQTTFAIPPNNPYNVLKKKENLKTKDTAQTAALTTQAEVWEKVKEIYEIETGHKFNSQKKDFVILSDLIKKHGIESVKEKLNFLYTGCKHAVFWFTQRGFSDFSVGTLSTHWNRLIPIETKEQKERRKNEEFAERFAAGSYKT